MAGQVISLCLKQLKVITGVITSAALEQAGASAVHMTTEQFNAIKDVEKGVEKLRSNLTAIQAVLSDAEKAQVDSATLRNWLDKLQKVSQDISDALNEWIAAIGRSRVNPDEGDEEEEEEGGEDNYDSPIKKARLFVSRVSSWFFRIPIHKIVLRLNIASKIKELNERLDRIADEKRKYSFDMVRVVKKRDQCRRKTTSFVDVSRVYGRDREKEVLMIKLLNKDASDIEHPSAFEMVSVVGTQGIGKTTLAQLVYNDNEVKNHFDKRIWLCVSDPFDETSIMRAIIEGLEGRAVDFVEMESLLQRVHASIEGKRFFLVLDDVCAEGAAQWEVLKVVLKNGARGSWILVTTREEEVAVMMGTKAHNVICLEVLPEEVSGRVPRPA